MATKQDVISNKRCGIKWYEHVLNEYDQQLIIDNAIDIYKEFPTIWGPGWPTMHWAFHNSFREAYSKMKVKFRNNDQSSFNLDEVLSPAEIEYIKQKTGITDEYKDCWSRN